MKNLDYFENSVEIQNPFWNEWDKGKVQIALQPIGPAPLGDLRRSVARGEYGGHSQDYAKPRLATLPELVQFLGETKEKDAKLYQRILYHVLGLSDENPISSNDFVKTIESIAGKNGGGTKYFGMREAAYEGKGSGLSIAGNTLFDVNGRTMIVWENPLIRYDDRNGSLAPSYLGYDDFMRNNKGVKLEDIAEGIRSVHRFESERIRLLDSIEDDDFVKDGWSDKVLLAMLGEEDLVKKFKGIGPLTISPLFQNFFECSQPRTCVATLRPAKSANVYVGGYSSETGEGYHAFVARGKYIKE